MNNKYDWNIVKMFVKNSELQIADLIQMMREIEHDNHAQNRREQEERNRVSNQWKEYKRK